jgi:murein DD-endopeptidase MepM/ murein hydrolase activator NlpD
VGDTIEHIAARYGVSTAAIELLEANGIRTGQQLMPGAEIFIPGGTQPLPEPLLARYGGVQGLADWQAQIAGKVREGQTNLRGGPGRIYVSLDQLDADVWVVPLARHGAWLKVEATGRAGWVHAELIALPDGVLDALPQTNDFPAPPPVWVWPARGILSSPFGPRWGRFHNGIDIANAAWTPIVAAYSGRVFEAGWCRGFGYCVKINHTGGVQTIYGHMVAQPVVRVGDEVIAGQRIGSMGSTYDASGGGYSTGVHLHFSVKIGGRTVNPLRFLP